MPHFRSLITSRLPMFVVVLALLVSLATPAPAQPVSPGLPAVASAPAGKVSERVRYIPFDDTKQLFEQNPRFLLLPRNTYEELRNAKEAFLARHPSSPLPRLDVDFVFGGADYRIVVRNRVAHVEGRILFEMPNSRWATLQLPGGDLGFDGVTLDGKPAGIAPTPFAGIQDEAAPRGQVDLLQKRFNAVRSLRPAGAQGPSSRRQPQNNDFILALEGPGSHELRFSFFCPQIDDPERNEVTFRIPRVPTNEIRVTVDSPAQFGEIDRAEGLEQGVTQDGTWFSGILGPTDRCTIRWAPSTAPTAEPETPPEAASSPAPLPQAARVEAPPRYFGETQVLHSIGEGFVRSETRLDLNILRSPTDQVTLLIPSGTELLDLRGDRLAGHELEIGTQTRLICRFTSQVKGAVSLELTTETRMTDVAQLLSLPVTRVLGAERDQGYIGIEARTTIEIRKTASLAMLPKVTAVDVSDLPAELTGLAKRPILLAFRYLEPPLDPPLELDVLRHADVPVLNAVIDAVTGTTVLTNDGSSVTCLDMILKNNGAQYLEARTASGTEILATAIDGAPVIASTRGSDTCLIPIGTGVAAAAGKNGFPVRLVYKLPAPASGLWYRMNAALPALGFDIMRLDWRIYAPDRYDLLAFASNLDTPFRRLRLSPLEFIGELMQLAQTGEVLLLVAFILGFYLLWNQIRGVLTDDGISWKRLGIIMFVIFGFIFLASVSGPMIGSITDQGTRNFAAPPMIRVDEEMDSAGSAEPAPESKLVDSLEDSMNEAQDMAFEKGRPEMRAKKQMGAPLGAPSAPRPVSKLLRKPSSGRDIGALPVDMQIPTGGSSVTVFRTHLPAGEIGRFRGIIFWEPLRTALEAGAWLIGFVFAILLWLAARGQRIWLAGASFLVLFAGTALLEQGLPGIQSGIWKSLFLFLILFLAGRKLIAFRRAGASPETPLLIVLVLLFSSGSLPAFAGTTPEADPRVEKTVDLYVPYSQLGDRLPRDGSFVGLTIDDYTYLKDLGIPEPDPSRWFPPLGVTFVSASCTAQVERERVNLSLRLEVQLHGKGYKQIEFPTDGVGVRSLTIEGVPALLAADALRPGPRRDDVSQIAQQVQQAPSPMQQQMLMNNAVPGFVQADRRPAILTDREGRVVIEARLVKDLTSRTRTDTGVDGFRLPLPTYGPAQFELILDRPDQAIDIQPAVVLERGETAGKSWIKAILQPAPAIQVEWRNRASQAVPGHQTASAPAVLPAPGVARIAVDHEMLFTVSEGVIAANDLVRLQIDQNPAGEFLFEIPAGADVLEVSGGDVASWICLPRGAAQELRVQLNARRMNQVELRIAMERQTPEINGRFALDLPRLRSAGSRSRIDRQNGFFGVEVRGGLEVQVDHSPEATGIDASELPENLSAQARGFIAQAFKYQKDATATVTVTKHRNIEVSTAQIDAASARTVLNAEGEALTRLDLMIRNNNNQFLVLRAVPERLKLLALLVNGEAMKPGRSAEGDISVPLIRSPRSGKAYTPFTVTLFFRERLGRLAGRGRLDLVLPQLSLDVSKMNWVVGVPEGFFLARRGGEFQLGSAYLPSFPAPVSPDRFAARRMSNVVSQNMPRGMGTTGTPTSAGLLPVIPSLPEAGEELTFNRKLITTGSRAPRLLLLYARESGLDLWMTAVILLTGLFVSSILHLAGLGRMRPAGMRLALLALVGIVVLGARSLFAYDLPWVGRLADALVLGIGTGFAIALLWWLMKPAEASDSQEIPPATQA